MLRALVRPPGLFLCLPPQNRRVTGTLRQCHDRGDLAALPVTSTQLTKPRPAEDTLIDALRGCRDVKELKALDNAWHPPPMRRHCSPGSAICSWHDASPVASPPACCSNSTTGTRPRATVYGERRLHTAARALPIRR